MANEEQLVILKRGVKVWNEWRQEHLLDEVDLVNANLSGTKLYDADLSSADLSGVRLVKADLHNTDLTETNLNSADLSGANLGNAKLSSTNLSDANLSNVTLWVARFYSCDLTGANLRKASFAYTAFTDCSTLHLAKGLADVNQMAPSTFDLYTLRACIHGLPDPFLLGAGYTRQEIEALRELYATKPIYYYSCFLSHCHKDEKFTDRLRVDLINRGISTWHYRYDAQRGKFLRAQINEAIKRHDKLVLVLSEESIRARPVVDEIIAAMERERETGEQKLFPVRLDDYILGREALDLADEMMAAGQWRDDWVRHVRAFYIGDFRKWKSHDAYEKEMELLVRDLKNPAPR